MAFYSVLRRASSSLLPLAFRSVGSSRAYRGAISSVLAVGKRQLCQDLSPGSFFPSPRFSTATDSELRSDDSLIRVLQSEIECAEEDELPVDEIPEGFPFEIEDNPGERTITLKRKYQDEVIKVEVDIPTVAAGEDEDEQAGDNEEEKSEESSIPLVVSVSKGSGLTLEFGVTAFPDEISIDSLSIKHSEESEDQLLYEGPEFHDLDENLQKAFHKYLEIRGIKPSTTNFLHEYMISKDSKEYLMWLKNLKSFVEK